MHARTDAIDMKTLHGWLGWKKLAQRLAILSAILGAPTLGYADDVVYLKQPVFQIPIQVASSRVSDIKELQLFVSTDRGQTWRMVRTARPSQQAFTFRAQADGEYWFTLAYIDQEGRSEPEDIEREPPGLKVVLDTHAPEIQLRPTDREGNQYGAIWQLSDEKLDLDSLQIEVKGASEPEWRSVQVPRMSEGKGDWIGDPSESYSVRATVRDRAGNVSVQRIEIPATEQAVASRPAPRSVSESPVAETPRPLDLQGGQYAVPPPPSGEPIAMPIPRAGEQVAEAPSAPSYNAPPPSFVASAVPPSYSAPQSYNAPARSSSPQSYTVQRPVFDRSRPDLPADFRPGTQPIQQVNAESAVSTVMDSMPRTPIASTTAVSPRTAAAPERPAEPERKKVRLSNSKHFAVDYKLRGVGPSGVGKVELYQTTDNGTTWSLYGEDPDRQPPFEVTVPSDGRYGLTIVVTSPAGFGQRPPKPGDLPQMNVEVDTTPPVAELYQPVPDPNNNNESLLISWNCHDTHLADQPVGLYFAEFPEGPWYAIKGGLPAKGQFSWRVLENTPHHVYLRLMATDLGNNVSVADTPEPIIVDLARPEADVVDVIGILPDDGRILR